MNQWKGRSVVVIGLARSGVATAKTLHQLGAHVIVNEAKERTDCPEAEQLEALGIPVICGGHPDDLITDTLDVIVKNPGVPYHIAPIQEALAKQIPVITEVELADQLTEANVIGITGSNGKTTTTTLVGKMLHQDAFPVNVAGNIGTALIEVAPRLRKEEWLVAELSSFQLKGTVQFHPHVAACLNIYPAHLDYHQTFSDYQESKAHLFQNQTSDDYAVLNKDSKECRELGETLSSQVIWFSRLEPVEQGVFVRDGKMIAQIPKQAEQMILPVDQIALPGIFNLENALAATAIALCCGCSPSAIADVLTTFCGVEHRLEYVTKVQGVTYFNDSKATNPQAATNALQSFTSPVIWIAGGLDRGIDFKEMLPVMKKHVKTLIAYGQSAPILLERAAEAGVANCFQVKEIEAAVRKAASESIAEDIVLLSPACASWDQYTSFEERGSIFKQAVHML